MEIWKFSLQIAAKQSLLMPQGATILSVANQRDTLCLWAVVDPKATPVRREFDVFGTGHTMPELIGVFVGTVLIGSFVWHVFERR